MAATASPRLRAAIGRLGGLVALSAGSPFSSRDVVEVALDVASATERAR